MQQLPEKVYVEKKIYIHNMVLDGWRHIVTSDIEYIKKVVYVKKIIIGLVVNVFVIGGVLKENVSV